MGHDGHLTESQINTIQTVSVIASAFSILGSGFILFNFFAFTALRAKFAFRLVAILSAVDMANQLGDFLYWDTGKLAEHEDPDNQCLAQAWMESFFELSSVLWTTAIAATLYLTVFRHYKTPDLEARFPIFLLFCFGVPLVLTVIPGVLGMYGHAGAWCWVDDDHDSFRFIQFFIPLWLAVCFNAYVYIRVIHVLRATMQVAGGDDRTSRQLRSAINRLRWYPGILVAVWFFATVNRIVESLNGGSELFMLALLQKMFSSLQGFLNAFAYGLSGGVRETIRDRLSKCCPRFIKPTQLEVDKLIGPGSRPQHASIDMTPVSSPEPGPPAAGVGMGVADVEDDDGKATSAL